MNVCRKCGGEFPNWTKVDGKRVNLASRAYCLGCSPYVFGRGKGNKATLENYKNKQKRCVACDQFLAFASFYSYRDARNKKQFGSRCKSCTHAHYVSIKQAAVTYMGGKCSDCSGKFHYSVFDFHHLDPKQKDMNVMANHPKSLDAIKSELDKCVLLCSNCHRCRHNDPANPHYLPL